MFFFGFFKSKKNKLKKQLVFLLGYNATYKTRLYRNNSTLRKQHKNFQHFTSTPRMPFFKNSSNKLSKFETKIALQF